MSAEPCVDNERMELSGAVAVSSGSYRRLIANKGFRRLWLAGFVSGVGDWLIIGFLMPYVTALSGGSSFAVAGIMIAKIIPALFFSSVIGVLVDRFDRRRMMIVADLSRAALTLGLFFTEDLFLIYLVVMLMEIFSLFFFPARNALIPYMVAEEDVTAANGLTYTTQQASMLIGLAASGAILAAFEWAVRFVLQADLTIFGSLLVATRAALLGPKAGVFVNSLTFIVSALFILGIRIHAKAPTHGGKFDLSLVGKDVMESYRFLRGHEELRAFLITIGLAILGGGAIIPVGLVHVQQNLTGGVPLLERFEFLERLVAAPQTFMMVFLAIGMIAGALIVPRLAGRMSLQMLFLSGVSGFGIAMFGFATVDLYWVASLFGAMAGFGLATVTVAGNTYVIYAVADEIRGRVFTALESVIRVALLVSMIVMAPLGDITAGIVKRIIDAQGIAAVNVTITGSQLTLQLGSLIVMAAAVYAYRNLNLKGCEEEEESE